MAEVVWQARRVSDGVLVDVTGDTAGTPAVAPTPNALEAGGSGLPDQWTATADGQVTAEADTTDEAVLTVKAPADSELTGNLVFQVQGETGLPLLDLDPYGNLTLEGASVDRTNGGGSLTVKGGPVASSTRFYMGFDGTGTPVASFFQSGAISQPAAIADATDEASAVDRLNDLLAAMRSLGLIDT